MNKRPVIVVSATRFFQGGTLVIVAECLKFLAANYSKTHTIKALVYQKGLFDQIPGIDWVEFPKSRNTIFHRLYDEYIHFNKLSKNWRPVLWLSLQDSTPLVKAEVRAVYYHNPLLLKPKGLNLWRHQPRLEILRLLYKYIYTKGMKANDFVITQQAAIASYLLQAYKVDKEKVWVFPPTDYLIKQELELRVDGPNLISWTFNATKYDERPRESSRPYSFIFPATAFYYKNHAVILAACRILQQQSPALKYRVLLTIEGSENRYIQKLVSSARREFPQVLFLGFLKRSALFKYYDQADCMIFPSLLESWGLPLTEFAALGKPVICADLPYGRSTLAGYNKAVYFNPSDGAQLARLMRQAMLHQLNFIQPKASQENSFQYLATWKECFELLLTKQ